MPRRKLLEVNRSLWKECRSFWNKCYKFYIKGALKWDCFKDPKEISINSYFPLYAQDVPNRAWCRAYLISPVMRDEQMSCVSDWNVKPFYTATFQCSIFQNLTCGHVTIPTSFQRHFCKRKESCLHNMLSPWWNASYSNDLMWKWTQHWHYARLGKVIENSLR